MFMLARSTQLRGGAAVSCTCALLLAVGTVRAQAEPTPDASAPPPTAAAGGLAPLSESLTGQAKDDYNAARILIGDNDFAGAQVKFAQALEHSGDLRLLWNMAVCEKNLRHYVNVLQLLTRYQREGDARMTEQQRAEVAAVVQTVRTLISRVHLEVDQDAATVFVDDKQVGTTPLPEPLLIDLGRRRIRASKPGYDDAEIVQDIAGGSELSFSLALKPEVHAGRLSISAESASSIRIDGAFVGYATWQGELPAGEHSLQVTAPGKRAYSQELVLSVGQVRSLQITLEREKSGISPLVWIGAGVLVAGGLATGAYFLLRPTPASAQSYVGTLGTVALPM
jgi:PEGA domain